MSFFEPTPPPPPREKSIPRREPPWVRAPENELGVSVPQQLIMARTEDFVVALVEVVAYSTGFTVQLVVQFPPGTGVTTVGMLAMDELRFGVGFSDGRKAMTPAPLHVKYDEPPPISLRGGLGGGGGGSRWTRTYSIYPLPPPGPLTIAVEWEKQGVPEQIHSIAAGPIIEAAPSSLVMWEDERPFR